MDSAARRSFDPTTPLCHTALWCHSWGCAFQGLTCTRGDFMIVHAFGKYVEEKLMRDRNNPRNVNLTTFEPGPFQAFVKKTLHTIHQEIWEGCKQYNAPCPDSRRHWLLSEWLQPNYMVSRIMDQEDAERMTGHVTADTILSCQGQCLFSNLANDADEVRSNRSVFGDPKVDDNTNWPGAQQNPNMDQLDQQTLNPETRHSAWSTCQWHLFFVSEMNPFAQFYGPYQDIYGNWDVYGHPYVGKAMHDYTCNQHHPERYPLVCPLQLQRQTALDQKDSLLLPKQYDMKSKVVNRMVQESSEEEDSDKSSKSKNRDVASTSGFA